MSLIVFIIFVVLCLGSICLGGYLDDGRPGFAVPLTLYVLGAVFGMSAVWGVIDAVHTHDNAEDTAIVAFEDRYGISIDEYDYYNDRPSRWRIDDVWRECYVTDDDATHAVTARLMCDVYQPGKPKFAEVTPVSHEGVQQ